MVEQQFRGGKAVKSNQIHVLREGGLVRLEISSQNGSGGENRVMRTGGTGTVWGVAKPLWGIN